MQKTVELKQVKPETWWPSARLKCIICSLVRFLLDWASTFSSRGNEVPGERGRLRGARPRWIGWSRRLALTVLCGVSVPRKAILRVFLKTGSIPHACHEIAWSCFEEIFHFFLPEFGCWRYCQPELFSQRISDLCSGQPQVPFLSHCTFPGRCHEWSNYLFCCHLACFFAAPNWNLQARICWSAWGTGTTFCWEIAASAFAHMTGSISATANL